MASPELLAALRHADSAFPSGGFAFSQGMEAAASLAERLGPFDFDAFLANQILHRFATADRVALTRSHRLGGDPEATAALDAEVEASTPVEALRLGSRRNGMALLTAHGRMGVEAAASYRSLVRAGKACGHLAVVQGLLWRAAGIGEEMAVAIAGYQAAMSLATAAVRLGIVGAIEAQNAISRTLPLVEAACAEPVAEGAPLSSFAPLSEIAAMLHGAAGQRLFSN